MTKRKTKRFGSPPEAHKRMSRYYLKQARVQALEVADNIKRGDCASAARALPMFIADVSAASRERAGARGGKARKGNSAAFNVRRSLWAKFVKACVK